MSYRAHWKWLTDLIFSLLFCKYPFPSEESLLNNSCYHIKSQWNVFRSPVIGRRVLWNGSLHLSLQLSRVFLGNYSYPMANFPFKKTKSINFVDFQLITVGKILSSIKFQTLSNHENQCTCNNLIMFTNLKMSELIYYVYLWIYLLMDYETIVCIRTGERCNHDSFMHLQWNFLLPVLVCNWYSKCILPQTQVYYNNGYSLNIQTYF